MVCFNFCKMCVNRFINDQTFISVGMESVLMLTWILNELIMWFSLMHAVAAAEKRFCQMFHACPSRFPFLTQIYYSDNTEISWLLVTKLQKQWTYFPQCIWSYECLHFISTPRLKPQGVIDLYKSFLLLSSGMKFPLSATHDFFTTDFWGKRLFIIVIS